jgi:hypothetical protein
MPKSTNPPTPLRIGVIYGPHGHWYAAGWSGAKDREIQELLHDVDHLSDWSNGDFGTPRFTRFLDVPTPQPPDCAGIQERAPAAVATAEQDLGRLRDCIYLTLTTDGPQPVGCLAERLQVAEKTVALAVDHSWFVRLHNGLIEPRNSRSRSAARPSAAVNQFTEDDDA